MDELTHEQRPLSGQFPKKPDILTHRSFSNSLLVHPNQSANQLPVVASAWLRVPWTARSGGPPRPGWAPPCRARGRCWPRPQRSAPPLGSGGGGGEERRGGGGGGEEGGRRGEGGRFFFQAPGCAQVRLKRKVPQVKAEATAKFVDQKRKICSKLVALNVVLSCGQINCTPMQPDFNTGTDHLPTG